MTRIHASAILLFVGLVIHAQAQTTGPDIKRYLSMIDNGQSEQVRGEIPALLTHYPNNPGVLYLQGLTTKEGPEAVRIYQSIVDNFPKSEYADHALYKVYQFYYALGLYRTAELKMNQMKKEYPSSVHLTGLAEPVTKGMPEERPRPVAIQPRDSGRVPAGGAAEKVPVVTPAERSDAGRDLQVRFALQVGAYTTQVNAEKQKLFFEDLGYPVEVFSKVKDNRSLFLVLVGNYATYDEAKGKSLEIRQKYKIDSFVISK